MIDEMRPVSVENFGLRRISTKIRKTFEISEAFSSLPLGRERSEGDLARKKPHASNNRCIRIELLRSMFAVWGFYHFSGITPLRKYILRAFLLFSGPVIFLKIRGFKIY